MLNIDEYRKELLEDVRATAESESEGTVASFVKVCASKLFESDVLPDYSVCYYQGNGRNNKALRVDGYTFDDRDGTFYLLTVVYDGSSDIAVIQGSEAKQALDRCRVFAENAAKYKLSSRIEMSTSAYDLASYIEEQFNYIRKFVIILLTDKALSERAARAEGDSIDDVPVEYWIWDISRFFRIYGTVSGREEIEIDFRKYLPGGIPCLTAGYADAGNFQSFLCTVPGDVLAELYTEYGSRLLEGNVRSFLSLRGKVNKSIRNTILNEPEKFFVYNNGLSATTTEAIVDKGRLLFAKDLQIVNGGQTTATLSITRKSDKADLSKVYVLMKLTQVQEESASVVIPRISRSANSQNGVKETDFFSNHDYHIRMEQISRRLFAPAVGGAQYETHWFYERARGQYTQATMQMTPSEERKYKTQNPKSQIITKTDLAKVINSWEEFPHIVSKGAEANFSEFAKGIQERWEKNSTDFNENYYKETVALVIIYRIIDQMVTKQPWYESGYKANIVTYSMALLHRLLSQWFLGQSIDLMRIWRNQAVPEILCRQLEPIMKAVFISITDPNRPIMNVTQWCKRLQCWETVRNITPPQIHGIETIMIGKEEIKTAVLEARTVRKVDDTIDAQIRVLELGSDYWIRLHQWLQKHAIANEIELRAVKASQKISIGQFPNDRQCAILLTIRARAIDEGFPEK